MVHAHIFIWACVYCPEDDYLPDRILLGEWGAQLNLAPDDTQLRTQPLRAVQMARRRDSETSPKVPPMGEAFW